MRFNYQQRRAGYDPPEPIEIDIEGVSDDDHIVRQITRRKSFYEFDLLEHLSRRGPRGGVYLDVGANIGNHSLFFGKFLADFVVCIEPASQLIPVLTRNLTANGVADYLIVPRAVGRSAARGNLILPTEFARNIGASRVVLEDSENRFENPGEPIELTTVDLVVEGLSEKIAGQPITFIKIDVEKLEIDVLEGAKGVIDRFQPQLAIELGTTDAFQVAYSFLAPWGYQPIGRFCATPTYHFAIPHFHDRRRCAETPHS